MATDLQMIQEINPQTTRWTCEVQVVEKGNPRTSATTRKFQRLILEDNEGTQVQATIFGDDITTFKNTLTVNGRYFVSNAMVRDILPKYRIIQNKYQWMINAGTPIEEIALDSANEKPRHYNFTQFSDLQPHTEASSTVDIIALAIRISSPRQTKNLHGETSVQDLLLLTHELRPITLTIWDQFVLQEGCMIANIIDSWPILLATRLKVTTYEDALCLSSKSTSFFMINPNIPAATSLRSWSNDNKNHIENIILGTPSAKRTRRTFPTDDIIVDIATATHSEATDLFWVKATAAITNYEQNFWYIGCSNCYRTIYADSGKIYNCLLCNKREVIAEPRCRFEVELRDVTGSLQATCLGQNAEKLFPVTASELKEKTNENGITDADYLANISPTGPQLFLLKSYNHHRGIYKKQRSLTITEIRSEETNSSSAANSK